MKVFLNLTEGRKKRTQETFAVLLCVVWCMVWTQIVLSEKVYAAITFPAQSKTDGYMTAWMLYQLQADENAGKVFVGNDAELLYNSKWQDVEKNN